MYKEVTELTSPKTARRPLIRLASARVTSFALTSNSALICSLTIDSILLKESASTGLPTHCSIVNKSSQVNIILTALMDKPYREKNQISIFQEQQ
jgi:hypothetical protein